MKKILTIFFVIISTTLFSQVRLAQQSDVTPMTYSQDALIGMAILQQQKKERFDDLYDKARTCWYESYYECVIYHYNNAKKLGWKNSSFYEIVGDSYKSLEKNFMAKRFYKKSYKMGNYSAKNKFNDL